MKQRSKARIFAIQMLYQAEVTKEKFETLQEYFWKREAIKPDQVFHSMELFRWLFVGQTDDAAQAQESFDEKVAYFLEYGVSSPDDEISIFRDLFWSQNDPNEEIKIVAEELPGNTPLPDASNAPNSLKKFANLLVKGTLENLEQIDRTLNKIAVNWHLNRMDIVDLSILRSATHEVLFLDDIPTTVSISEAIQLAETFGTDNSTGFVNGILDKIVNSL